MAAAPATAADFLALTRKSGVVAQSSLDDYIAQLEKSAELPRDPAKLAGILIKDGLLTDFQAENLLRGKYSGFTLGKYKILKRIGAGGMGAVFLAEHINLRRTVALKVLPADKAEDPACLGRFHREAQAVAALNHPNIVRAYDVDRDGKTSFLVMEYVEGETLQDIVKTRGPLEISQAVDVIKQVAAGLDHAHRAGLVHRDIKPANILVSREPVGAGVASGKEAEKPGRTTYPAPAQQVKILDMGLALFFHDDADGLTREFENNAILGTADYLSPEQGRDSHDVDIRSDIYSLGATFYFLLAGRPPFAGGNLRQKLIWHQIKAPDPVRTHRPEVPASLEAVIAKMMAKDLADRYQTPAEVVQALSCWESGPAAETNRPVIQEDRSPASDALAPSPLADNWLALLDTVRQTKGSTAVTHRRPEKEALRSPRRWRRRHIAALFAGAVAFAGAVWLVIAANSRAPIQGTAQPPKAPINLRAVDGDFGEVELTWENRADNATAIQVERANDPRFTQHRVALASLAADTSRYTDKPLEIGLPLYYRITVTNAAGDAATSNIAAPAPSYARGFNGNGLVLNGGAVLAGSSLRLTDAAPGPKARTAFYATPLDVESFTTAFRFQIGAGANTADGFTCCIQNNDANQVGAAAAGLGYQGIPKSLAVKFDLWSNAGEGNNSTGLYLNGAPPDKPGSIDLTGTGIDLHNGHPYDVILTYQKGRLELTIADATDSKKTFQKTFAIDIPATVGGQSAYFGFTGGTGTIGAVQDVLTWTYRPLVK
jgi:serine/threonine protein kinase